MHCVAVQCTHQPLPACLPPTRPTHNPPPLPQVMGLTTALGVLEGTNSHLFAISLVFSLIVSAYRGGGLCCLWPGPPGQHHSSQS